MQPNLESFVLRICDTRGETKGAGFVVSDDLAVTCAHVVENCKVAPGGRVWVIFHANGAKCEAEVLPDFWRPAEADDVAIVRILPIGERLPKGIRVAKLGSALRCHGHPMRALGFPLLAGGYDAAFAEGTLRGVVPHPGKRPMLQIDATPIRRGMSGAPVLDLDTGCVVGMVNEYLPGTPMQSVQWATTSDTLHEICPNLLLHLPQAVEDYLNAVRDYYASLPYLTLHDIRPPRTLDEVYVPLKARPLPRKTDQPERDDEHAMREAIRSGPLSIADVVREKTVPHVLILGEPGAGKSTLLRQLAERAWNAPEQIGLDSPHLPILVPLRRLAGADGSVEKRLNRALTGEMALAQDLPDGFLDRWPHQTGAHWLILLDALDEVPEAERAHLMHWLKGVITSLGHNRLVITSRPSGYAVGELGETIFGHYDLLPFTPEQTGEFARKWFGDKANDFLKELERIRAGELRGTPLLLTIAAKVYVEQRGALPERRSALYEQFVDIWLKEAERRGLLAELGERISKVARFALARLALAMTEQPGNFSEIMLSQMAAAYLHDALHLSEDEAEADGRKFVEVMARRSGVLVRRGDAYDFIHPTFREYLTAWTVARECEDDPAQVWRRVISRWEDENWREVALFALSILSDEDKDVTKWVRRIWWSGKGVTGWVRRIRRSDEAGPVFRRRAAHHRPPRVRRIRRSDEAGLYFAAMALAEQVKVETKLADDFIDNLIEQARRLDWWWSHRQPNPMTALGELRGWPRAADGLLALARDERVWVTVCHEVFGALSELGRVDELLALARDGQVEAEVRVEAAEALGRLGRVDELLALARDERVEAGVRVKAVIALGRLGRVDEAVPILLALARDEQVEVAVRLNAAAALGRLGRVDELLALARDAQVEAWVRVQVAKALGELGRVDDAVPILLALARDAQVEAWVRVQAAKALGELGRVDDAVPILLALARDAQVEAWVRVQAAKALGELGRVDEAAPILLALARDERAWAVVRVQAAKALGELGRVDEAAPILLALARDEREAEVRVQAAEALGRLGRVDEAVPILLALARDERVEAWNRLYAAAMLGFYGDVRLLPELENIAQRDANKQVRRAAGDAIERIRGRSAR